MLQLPFLWVSTANNNTAIITCSCSSFCQPQCTLRHFSDSHDRKIPVQSLFWQSYPWSWKSWLSWRTRRSNLPSVSWRSMGTHQSWMALMTRYPRITCRTLYSLKAFFTFDARLTLHERRILTPQNKRQTSHFQTQRNTHSWAGTIAKYNIWCTTNDPQIISDGEWLKRDLGDWKALASVLNNLCPQPLTQNSSLYFSIMK